MLVLIGYLLRPIMPFIDYALNKSYIEKNLCVNRNKPQSCCHGKCHLKKELAKQVDDSTAEKKTDNKKISSNNEVKEFLVDLNNLTIVPTIKRTYTEKTSYVYTFSLASSIFVPPQQIV